MKAVYPLLLAAVLGFSVAPASAQVTPGDPAGNQTIPEKDQSRPQDMPKGEKKGGVIRPPQEEIDPGISKPAPVPEPNSTPVIPPPGTPRGRPGPEPKSFRLTPAEAKLACVIARGAH